MTYIELSADNTFYEAFMSALFLPHTDLTLFPTVAKLKKHKQNKGKEKQMYIIGENIHIISAK